jgi:transcriptional regulator with XRE-family HTH domain
MKLGLKSSKILSEKMEKQREAAGLSYSDLAAAAGVHHSQVSRICRGQFVTLTGNVLQICVALGIDPHLLKPDAELLPSEHLVEQKLRNKVVESALAMWDRTPEGADRLVRLFGDLVDLARSSSRE